MIKIRRETPEDIKPIYNLNVKAFGQTLEADLVNRLRASNALSLSLVAIEDDKVVGHIAFSIVTIEPERATLNAIDLGPMAVLPERQGAGIGSQLVKAGLREVQELGYEIVMVLGFPDYYSRFGFIPAKKFGIQWRCDVPEEAFMIKVLRNGALKEVSGDVRFHTALDESFDNLQRSV
jgi:putative acetyltransferase